MYNLPLKRCLISLAVAAIGPLAAVPASAQIASQTIPDQKALPNGQKGTDGIPVSASSPLPPTIEEAQSVKLETVIVKSQRREERLQDVPVVVKAFSAKQIEASGIKSTQDFINMTPNMSMDNAMDYANSFVVIRGLSSFNNADFPVAVVVDGVPQGNQKQLKMNLFDVQSIEVLKGPQGALYGRNAIGGAINIETKQPKNKFEGIAGIDIGNGAAVELSGGLSGALVDDKVLLRVVAQSKKSDGILENTYLHKKVDAIDHDNSVRAKLTVHASDTVKLDLRASWNDYRAGANWDSIVNPIGTVRTPNDIMPIRSSLLGYSVGTTEDYSVKADVETGLGVLTAITGYTDLRTKFRGDIDFSNATELPGGFRGTGFQRGQGQNLTVKLLSQELRLTSPVKQSLRWIAGVYYLNTKRDLEGRVFDDITGQLSQWETGFLRQNPRESNNNTASAVFGQLDYDLAKDLILSGALRYDRDERRQTDLATGLIRSAAFDALQPKVTLTKKVTTNVMSYLTYSTGFRSGGFNAPGLGDLGQFRAEHLTNYEIGTKTTLLDGSLILNGAAFFSTSKDYQFFYLPQGKGQVIANIDKVEIKGADFDFRYIPGRGWQLDGGIGIADGKIIQNVAEPTSVGNHPPKANPVKVTLGIQYAAPAMAGLETVFRLDMEHRGKKYWHPNNVDVSNAMDLVNLRIGLNEVKGTWSASFYVRNLTDKKYYSDYYSASYTGLSYGAGLPLNIGSLAPPRTFGIEGKFRF